MSSSCPWSNRRPLFLKIFHIISTVEPLLMTTPDRRPPAYYGHSPWVQNASPFTTMLQKPLIYGHLSTPYNGHFSWPQTMPSMHFNLCTTASPTHQLAPPTSLESMSMIASFQYCLQSLNVQVRGHSEEATTIFFTEEQSDRAPLCQP